MRRQDCRANRLAAYQPIGSPTASPVKEEIPRDGREEKDDEIEAQLSAAGPPVGPCHSAHGAPADEVTHARSGGARPIPAAIEFSSGKNRAPS
jgi:hypothetical protein